MLLRMSVGNGDEVLYINAVFLDGRQVHFSVHNTDAGYTPYTPNIGGKGPVGIAESTPTGKSRAYEVRIRNV